MKFITQPNELQKILQKVFPSVPARANFEVLEYMHFSLSENKLTVTASDVEVTIKSKIIVEGKENGAVLVPAKKINDIAKVLDNTKDVVFDCDEEDLKITISSGSRKYTLVGFDVDSYIKLSDMFDKEIPEQDKSNENFAYFSKDVIHTLTEKTHFAVSTEEYRLNMSGVLFQFREHYVNAVSTDSFRLVRSTALEDDTTFPDNIDITIPIKAVDILKNADDDITMLFNVVDGKIKDLRIDIGDTIVVTHLIVDSFPKYESIIPKKTNCQAICDVKELISALKAVSPLTNPQNKKCALSFTKDNLKVSVADNNGEGAVAEISAELIDAEDFTINFNLGYLEQMLNNIHSETTDNIVQFFFINSDKAALIKPKSEKDSLLMILMPIRTGTV